LIQTSNSILPDCDTHLLQVRAALELYVPVQYFWFFRLTFSIVVTNCGH